MRRATLLIGILAACSGTESLPDIPAGSQSVPFTTLNSLFGAKRIQNNWTAGSARQVIHNQAEWNQLFQTVTGTSPAPVIDFTDQHAFFAATGVKISTGNDIVIDEIRKAPDGRLYIVVRSISPGSGCGAQSVTTSPVTAVLTISVYNGITWLERQSVNHCTSS